MEGNKVMEIYYKEFEDEVDTIVELSYEVCLP